MNHACRISIIVGFCFFILFSPYIDAYEQLIFGEEISLEKTISTGENVFLKGVASKTIDYSTDLGEVSLLGLENFDYIDINGFKSDVYPGRPTVPYKVVEVILPKNSEVLGLKVNNGKYTAIENSLDIMPGSELYVWKNVQANEKKESSLNLVMEEKIYFSDKLYPGEFFSYTVGEDNIQKHVFVRIYPVQYNPHDKKAIILTQANIEILYEEENEEAIISSFLENNGVINTTITNTTIRSEVNVIITHPDFYEQAARLADLHDSKGTSSFAINTTTIWENYDEAEDPSTYGYADTDIESWDLLEKYNYSLAKKIITYLRNNKTHPNISYITLFGNAIHVPPSYYAYINQCFIEHENWIPTDLYYMSPDYDNYPNFMIGRLPVNSSREAGNLVDKISDWYDHTNWEKFNNIDLYGGKPFHTQYYFGEMMVQNSVNSNYFNGMDVKKFYHSENNFTFDNLYNSHQGGNGFVYSITHGSGDCLKAEDGFDDSICAQDLVNVPKKESLPIVVSIACSDAAYDTNVIYGGFSRSFGEGVLLTNASGIAYIGGSRLNYGTPSFVLENGSLKILEEPFMAGILTDVFKAYHEGSESLGSISFEAVKDYVGKTDFNNEIENETLYSYTLLGDPALNVPEKVKDVEYSVPNVRTSKPDILYSDIYGNDSKPYFFSSSNFSLSVNSNSSFTKTKIYDVYEGDLIDYYLSKMENGSYVIEKEANDITDYLLRSESDDFKEGWLYYGVTVDSDEYEPDNNRTAAKIIYSNNTEQRHSLTPGDEDWMAFNASAGNTYSIETFDLDGTDTELFLYKAEEFYFVDVDDDGGDEFLASKILFKCTQNGTYYLKVINFDTIKSGFYSIRINMSESIDPIILIDKDNYVLGDFMQIQVIALNVYKNKMKKDELVTINIVPPNLTSTSYMRRTNELGIVSLDYEIEEYGGYDICTNISETISCRYLRVSEIYPYGYPSKPFNKRHEVYVNRPGCNLTIKKTFVKPSYYSPYNDSFTMIIDNEAETINPVNGTMEHDLQMMETPYNINAFNDEFLATVYPLEFVNNLFPNYPFMSYNETVEFHFVTAETETNSPFSDNFTLNVEYYKKVPRIVIINALEEKPRYLNEITNQINEFDLKIDSEKVSKYFDKMENLSIQTDEYGVSTFNISSQDYNLILVEIFYKGELVHSIYLYAGSNMITLQKYLDTHATGVGDYPGSSQPSRPSKHHRATAISPIMTSNYFLKATTFDSYFVSNRTERIGFILNNHYGNSTANETIKVFSSFGEIWNLTTDEDGYTQDILFRTPEYVSSIDFLCITNYGYRIFTYHNIPSKQQVSWDINENVLELKIDDYYYNPFSPSGFFINRPFILDISKASTTLFYGPSSNDLLSEYIIPNAVPYYKNITLDGYGVYNLKMYPHIKDYTVHFDPWEVEVNYTDELPPNSIAEISVLVEDKDGPKDNALVLLPFINSDLCKAYTDQEGFAYFSIYLAEPTNFDNYYSNIIISDKNYIMDVEEWINIEILSSIKKYDLALSSDHEEKAGTVGESLNFNIKIENKGNTRNTYHVSVLQNDSIEYVNLSRNITTLEMNQTGNIELILSDSDAGTYEIVLQVQSLDNSSIMDNITLTATFNLVEVEEVETSKKRPRSRGSFVIFPTDIIKTQIFPELNPGTVNIILFNDMNISLSSLVFQVDEESGRAEFVIKKVDELPIDVLDATGMVYEYFEIIHENVNNSNLMSTEVYFKIKKSWMEDNDIENVNILRYNKESNGWDIFVADKTGEDANYLYFKAGIPGFSLFAVSGKAAEEVPEVTTDEERNIETLEIVLNCDAGTLQCFGDTLKKCDSEGKEWLDGEACEFGCVNATCLEPETSGVTGLFLGLDGTQLTLITGFVIVLGLLYIIGRKISGKEKK